MSDIVDELLFRGSDEAGIGWTPTTIIPVPARLLHHAADEIERLRAALRDLLNASERHIFSTECQKERDAARAALGEKE